MRTYFKLAIPFYYFQYQPLPLLGIDRCVRSWTSWNLIRYIGAIACWRGCCFNIIYWIFGYSSVWGQSRSCLSHAYGKRGFDGSYPVLFLVVGVGFPDIFGGFCSYFTPLTSYLGGCVLYFECDVKDRGGGLKQWGLSL